MNIRNIFQRNPDDEVPVPEIEVDGDKVRVPRNEEAEIPGFEDPADSPEQGRKTREFRLPKTKWFHRRRRSVTSSKDHHPVSDFTGRENGW